MTGAVTGSPTRLGLATVIAGALVGLAIFFGAERVATAIDRPYEGCLEAALAQIEQQRPDRQGDPRQRRAAVFQCSS